MPYIKQEQRDRLEFTLTLLDAIMFHAESITERKCSPGVLNYIITRVIKRFLDGEPDYERFNAAIGALECAKQELYRRAIVDFEQEKCHTNGDVYDNTKSCCEICRQKVHKL